MPRRRSRRSVRGPGRVVLRSSNAELWSDLRPLAQRAKFRRADLLRTKRLQRPLAERDFRSGRARIPYETGRLRRSLEFRPTDAGINVISDLVYYFQARDALRTWWRRSGLPRFRAALHSDIREKQVATDAAQRRQLRNASAEERAAIRRGDSRTARRLRRNRLARENRRRTPEQRARRAEQRTQRAEFRRAEVRREVRAARGLREERIAAIQSRYRQRVNRRRFLVPKFRQAEFPAANRALRTGRQRALPGGGTAARRAQRLLALYRAARQTVS